MTHACMSIPRVHAMAYVCMHERVYDGDARFDTFSEPVAIEVMMRCDAVCGGVCMHACVSGARLIRVYGAMCLSRTLDTCFYRAIHTYQACTYT